MSAGKVGRNEPCPCGSGLKYKRCCWAAVRQESNEDRLRREVQRAHEELSVRLLRYAQRTLGPELIDEAHREFWLWSDKPSGIDSRSLEGMFYDWLFHRFVPEPLEKRRGDPELPDRPLVVSFLDKQSARLSNLERSILRAGQRRGNSLFAVRSVEPGVGLDLYDLLTQEELRVVDREASRHAERGMVLFGHVVPLREMPHFAACAGFPLPPTDQLAVLEARGELPRQRAEDEALDPSDLAEADLEVRDLYLTCVRNALGTPDELRSAVDPSPGSVTQYFELRGSAEQAFDALAPLAGRDRSELLETAETDGQGALVRVRIDWPHSTQAKGAEGSRATPRGSVTIDPVKRRLEAVAQSPQDARALRAQIEKLLPGAARYEREVRQGDPGVAGSSASADPLGHPGAQLDLFEPASNDAGAHWHAWLDASMPVLHDQTPRQAAGTTTGRERLLALLDGYQAHVPEADLVWLRSELGL